MKTIKVLSTLFALMLLPLAANAVPNLQLDCSTCTYDSGNEDSWTDESTFDVAAIISNGNNQLDLDATDGDPADQFWVSIALSGDGASGLDLGGAQTIFGALKISLDGGTTWVAASSLGEVRWGTPYNQTGDLPDHGIFDAFYIEFALDLGDAVTCETYDVQGQEGYITTGTGNSLCIEFGVDRSGVPGDVNLHFDLYSLRDGEYDRSAPFSKDVTSVPEPGTLSLLGLGLLALGLGRRRREIA